MLLFDVISLIYQFLIHTSDETDGIHILPNFHLFSILLLLLESVYYREYIGIFNTSHLFIILANSAIYLCAEISERTENNKVRNFMI